MNDSSQKPETQQSSPTLPAREPQTLCLHVNEREPDAGTLVARGFYLGLGVASA